MVNNTTDNTFTIEGVAPGVYLFTVLAFNVLGNGSESSIAATGQQRLLLFLLNNKLTRFLLLNVGIKNILVNEATSSISTTDIFNMLNSISHILNDIHIPETQQNATVNTC